MKFINFLLALLAITSFQCASGHDDVADEILNEFKEQEADLVRVSNEIVINDIILLQHIDTTSIDSLISQLDSLADEFVVLKECHDTFVKEVESGNEQLPYDSGQYLRLTRELRELINHDDTRLAYKNAILKYESIKKKQTIDIEIYGIIYNFRNSNKPSQVPLYSAVDNSQNPRVITFHSYQDNDLFNRICDEDHSLHSCRVMKTIFEISNLINHYNMKLSLITRINSLCQTHGAE